MKSKEIWVVCGKCKNNEVLVLTSKKTSTVICLDCMRGKGEKK